MKLNGRIAEVLDNARAESLLRRLRNVEQWGECVVMADGRELVDFSSSDYLCLAHDPHVLSYISRRVKEYGLGIVASPLVTGYTGLHAALEKKLATVYRKESSLLFPSGWQANVTTIPAIFGEGDVIYSDEKNHASLVDGCRLSRAKVEVFGHRDYAELRDKLKGNGGTGGLTGIISDTVFSIDGDTADVASLAELKNKYDAVLFLDAAHSLPKIGDDGESVLGFDNYLADADIVTTSLGKYFAAGGGMAACSSNLREMLINRARGYIYSGSYSVLLVLAVLAAVERIEGDPSLALGLKSNIEYLRTNLADMGILDRDGGHEGPICSVRIDATRVTEAYEKLIDAGLLVVPVRYPTVAKGTAKLRVSLMRGHTVEMLDKLLEGLSGLMKDGSVGRI